MAEVRELEDLSPKEIGKRNRETALYGMVSTHCQGRVDKYATEISIRNNHGTSLPTGRHPMVISSREGVTIHVYDSNYLKEAKEIGDMLNGAEMFGDITIQIEYSRNASKEQPENQQI